MGTGGGVELRGDVSRRWEEEGGEGPHSNPDRPLIHPH